MSRFSVEKTFRVSDDGEKPSTKKTTNKQMDDKRFVHSCKIRGWSWSSQRLELSWEVAAPPKNKSGGSQRHEFSVWIWNLLCEIVMIWAWAICTKKAEKGLEPCQGPSCIRAEFFCILGKLTCCILYPFLKKGIQDTTTKPGEQQAVCILSAGK